jgi:hypothetical protein
MHTIWELETFLLGHRATMTISRDKDTWCVLAMRGSLGLCRGFGKTLAAACDDALLDLRTTAKQRGDA